MHVAPTGDDDDLVREAFDVVHQMSGEYHRRAPGREPANQVVEGATPC